MAPRASTATVTVLQNGANCQRNVPSDCAPASVTAAATRQTDTTACASEWTSMEVPGFRGGYGSAKATTVLPDGAPFFPPPHAMTMYCLPFTV